MRLPNILKKIKESQDLPKDVFIVFAIFLVGIGGFLIGQYGAREEGRGDSLRIVSNVPFVATTRAPGVPTPVSMESKGMYVGSRKGTMYHLPWCSGAKRISEENKIWFSSKEEAVGRGYKPASNCEGI